MDKKFERELKKLAKKHNMEFATECVSCERSLVEQGQGNAYIVTFTEKATKEEE